MSCGNDDNTSNSENFKVRDLLSDEVNQQILPSISNFANEVKTFNTNIEAYFNQNTEDNLTIVRNQWKTIALAYETIYAFNIGEARDQFIHFSIYNWPATPNAIENFILDNVEINQEFINTLSPRSKSIAALEYLLFKTDAINTNAEFIASQKRRNYLKFASLFVKEKAIQLENIWLTSAGDYASTFINNTETGIDGSFNLFFNGLHNLIDTGKVTKIGKPAGLENSQVINPELTQAYFSNTSLDILRANINSIEKVYFNPQGLGIDDYVFAIMDNNTLNNLVQTKINEVNTAIDNIPGTLFDAITTNTDLVENLHIKLEELRILFAVDLRSTLSIIITSTDNDGD